MNIEKTRKGLQLIAGLSDYYVIDVETFTLIPIGKSHKIQSKQLIILINEIIDSAITALPKQMDFLCLLKKARTALANYNRCKLDSDRLLARIDNCCSRFEHKLIMTIEEIPSLLESVIKTSINSDFDAMLIAQSTSNTPSKTPSKSPSPDIGSVPFTPPSSPRQFSPLVNDLANELPIETAISGNNFIHFSTIIPHFSTFDNRRLYRMAETQAFHGRIPAFMKLITTDNSYRKIIPVPLQYLEPVD